MRRRSTISTMLPALFFLIIILSSSSHALSTPQSPFGQTTKNVATQVLQGTGQSQVDLNQYNLASLEQMQEEWNCVLVQKVTELHAVATLGAASSDIFVDTVEVSFPRLAGTGGLGLELVEWAGGRDDGLGITVIAGLVQGGSAAAAATLPPDILPGDSIAQVSLVRQRRQGTADVQEESVVQTECLSYEATVAAIQSLPPPPVDDNDNDNTSDYYFVLTLKRLRRKPKVTVHLQYPPSQKEADVTLELFAGENLRHGMLVRGVALNDALAKRFDTKQGGNCGAGGLCRTCAVAIQQQQSTTTSSTSSSLLNPQRVAEQQMLADNPRWRLACKAIVGYGMREGSMTVRVNPRQW